mmetsp:Transcript_531/g.1255  ORF Transcript_531/g.1255 Transcript_531/m.1255 type:complete len:158 (-) Transcript_531:82-555(-)
MAAYLLACFSVVVGTVAASNPSLRGINSSHTLVANRPYWCQYVPAAYQRDACISCTCADSCHHDVQNASSWKWMPECCACQKPDQHEKHFANLAAMTTVQEVTKGVSSLAVPSWCKYVPSPYQGDACMSCACSSSCYSGDFDVASWKWNPDCCACQQ